MVILIILDVFENSFEALPCLHYHPHPFKYACSNVLMIKRGGLGKFIKVRQMEFEDGFVVGQFEENFYFKDSKTILDLVLRVFRDLLELSALF